MESAKLVKATGEPLRALQELENSMRLSGLTEEPDTIDLTEEDDAEFKRMRAKASIRFCFPFKRHFIYVVVGLYSTGTLDERVGSLRTFAALEGIPDPLKPGHHAGECIVPSREIP